MSNGSKKWEERRQRIELRRAAREGAVKKNEKAGGKRPGLWPYAAVGLVVVVLIAAGLYIGLNRGGGDGNLPPAEEVRNNNSTTVVTVTVSGVGSSPSYYTYNSSGTVERFFLVKGTDGNIHGAMDACDVCYPLKKGYSQSGELMKCNNCGKTYPINSLGKDNTAGGCWPSHIAMKIVDGNVVINKSDLDAKAYLFK